MASVKAQVLQANEEYARRFGDLGRLAMPPARHFAILTCMDARLDPAKYGGLREGDAHVIRNAGGRVTDDAIRSLVISHKLLGTTEWLVVHHTHCGMETFTPQVMCDLLERSLETAQFDGRTWRDVGRGPGSTEGEFIDWLTIEDQERSLVRDVRRLRSHPLVPRDVAISGFLYDVTSGRLHEVEAATAAASAAPPTDTRGDHRARRQDLQGST